MDEPLDLLAQLRGRAQFCRDRGEIKTPEALEQAADRIEALEEALREIAEQTAGITPEPDNLQMAIGTIHSYARMVLTAPLHPTPSPDPQSASETAPR